MVWICSMYQCIVTLKVSIFHAAVSPADPWYIRWASWLFNPHPELCWCLRVVAVSISFSSDHMSVVSVLAFTEENSALAAVLPLDTLVLFIRLVAHLKEQLSWNVSASLLEPPALLPPNILQFLSLALDTHPTVLQECWAALCHHIWHSHVHTQGWGSSDLLDIFLSHGTALGIGMFSLILIMHSAHLVISRLL